MTESYSVLVLSHLYPRDDDPVYGRFVEQQALELAKTDQLRVMAPRPWVPPGASSMSARWRALAEAPDQEVRNGLTVLRPKFLALPRGLMLASSGRRLWSAIRTMMEAEFALRPFDLIHAHVAVPDGAAAVQAARHFGVPLLVTVHGADVNTTMARSSSLKRAVVDTCNAADAVAVVSTRLQGELAQAGVVSKKLRVVPNGIDPDEMDTARPGGELAEGRWIVAAGNLVVNKGFDDLIKAVSRLAPSYEDVRVAVVGAGPEEHRLRSLTKSLHLSDRVVFYGRQPPERLHRLMAAADVFALPSWLEGFGIVYLEAMALGRPVVGCRGQGIADVIEDGVTGLLVEPRHPDGFAAAIRRVLDDPEAAARMGRRAAREVRKKYTWEVNAAAVHGLYEELMARRAEPPEEPPDALAEALKPRTSIKTIRRGARGAASGEPGA